MVVVRNGFRFGRFELDTRARELRKDGMKLRVQDQPYEVLAMLLEQAGEVVTREELRVRLWPNGTFVDFEHGLNAAVKRLRATLGDTADRPRFVETLPRHGYRFIASATRIGPDPTDRPNPACAPEKKRRLAVLPLVDVGDRGPNTYFTDGLTEELITKLGRACASEISVTARFSSAVAQRRARTAREIGEALQADYLVEGTVRRDGDRVRINMRLVDARNDEQVWAESYERDLADCFSVQSEVAAEIAQSLALQLLPGAEWGRSQTHDVGAHLAYLKGRYHWNRPGPDGLQEAISFFETAATLDGAFSSAHSSLGRALLAAAEYYVQSPHSALEPARAAAGRALALDPNDSDAHLTMAEVYRSVDWDWNAAESSYRLSIVCNPSNEGAHRLYGQFLAARGRLSEAMLIADKARELDPMCLVVNTSAAWVRYLAGDFDKAIDMCRHTLDMERQFRAARRVIAASLLQMGQVQRAVSELEAVNETASDPVSAAWLGHALAVAGETDRAGQILNQLRGTGAGEYVSAYHVALAQVGLGDANGALASLERAASECDPALIGAGVDPRFRPLRFAPRYHALLERLGLHDGQSESRKATA